MTQAPPWLVNNLPGFVVLAVIGAILVTVAVRLVRAYKRRGELERRALEMGLRFARSAPGLPEPGLSGLALFGRGSSRSWTNVLTGSLDGMEALVCDFHYRVGSGRNSSDYAQTAAALKTARPLPSFELAPENLLHKIGQLFGYADIDFETHPEFSRRYLLRGPDETLVRQAFHPSLLAFFENAPGWNVESNGSWLLVYRHNRLSEPEDLRDFARQAREIAGLFSRP